ncbi:MAG: pyridoxal phosphate-dependent aminotransferase [Betaproteobacteria bacterium]
MPTHSLAARPAVQQLRSSKIREVANAGMGKKDVVAFWFGEPDEVTPNFIRQAGIEALNRGETFYTENLGLPALRNAIGNYFSRLHRRGGTGLITSDHIAVTSSGMSALMLTTQSLVGPGDRVVIVTPVWPNLVEIPRILGADTVTFPLSLTPAGWILDLDRLLATLEPGTRAVYINSPNNPTGWTIDREAQRAILEHCRAHGIWILSDDAYQRFFYGNGAAPSFLDIADTGDRIVSANTFSKSWLMTGWRLGWIMAPKELIANLGTLLEYNTSCAPSFVQRAGIVAIEQGEPVIARTLTRLRKARDFLLARLSEIPGIEATLPPGAMYAFFKVHGVTDSLAFCKKLVADAGLGLAPGIAFGPEGEGFVRWCFAASEERLAQGVERLRKMVTHH